MMTASAFLATATTRRRGIQQRTPTAVAEAASASGFSPDNNNDNNNIATNNGGAGEFAFQEMRALLTAMGSSKVVSRDMRQDQRNELAGYVREVCDNKISPINVRQDLPNHLPGTKWKLAFSTDPAALENLPRDANVYLYFHENNNLGVKLMDYVLQFSQKTFGLNRIQAESTWDFNSRLGDPQEGLLTMVYDKITTDVMGFENVGVGFFGLLQGRANYMYSAYFDGDFWIEHGILPTPTGTTTTTTNPEEEQPNFYYNVYVKANDDEIAL